MKSIITLGIGAATDLIAFITTGLMGRDIDLTKRSRHRTYVVAREVRLFVVPTSEDK